MDAIGSLKIDLDSALGSVDWGEIRGAMGSLGGMGEGPNGRSRGRKRLRSWRLDAVGVGEGGRLVAFSYDLEFAWEDGDRSPSTFAGVLDTARAGVREIAGVGRVKRWLVAPGGRFLVAIDGEVRVFDLAGEALARAWMPRGRFRAAAISADGRWLAVGTDQALGLYALGDGAALRTHVDTGQGGIRDLAFGGDALGLLGEDGTVLVLDAPRLAARALLPAE